MKKPKRSSKRTKAQIINDAAADLVALPAVVRLEGVCVRLHARIMEVEHDIRKLAMLVAEHLGEPFRTNAKEIMDHQQTVEAEKDIQQEALRGIKK